MTASNYAQAEKDVLVTEGGWANDPDDPGGPTMRGITQHEYIAWCAKNNRPRPTLTDLRNISAEDVAAIYKVEYWDAVDGDALPSGIDYLVFDFTVNSGSSRATMTLQAVVGTKPDGRLGPITLQAVKDAVETRGVESVVDDYSARRMAFLKGLSRWRKYSGGWTDRVHKVAADAKKMGSSHAEPAPAPQPKRSLRPTPSPAT